MSPRRRCSCARRRRASPAARRCQPAPGAFGGRRSCSRGREPRAAAISPTRRLARVRDGMNAVDERAGRHRLWLAHHRAGLRNGGQDRHRAGARLSPRRSMRAASPRTRPGLEAARPCACSSASRRSRARDMPAPASSSMARRRPSRRSPMARDVLLLRAEARSAGPAAPPIRSTPPRRAGCGVERPRDDRLVPMPPPSARCRVADKLLEVNWGLVLLITLIACVGFAMLYSVAGGHFQPWALHADRAISPSGCRASGRGGDRSMSGSG